MDASLRRYSDNTDKAPVIVVFIGLFMIYDILYRSLYQYLQYAISYAILQPGNEEQPHNYLFGAFETPYSPKIPVHNHHRHVRKVVFTSVRHHCHVIGCFEVLRSRGIRVGEMRLYVR